MKGEARESIRRAIASDEFAAAQLLWNAYAEQMRGAILDGSATVEMMTDTRELIDWSRMVVKAFRAHAADRVRHAHVARVYASCNFHQSR